MGYVTEDEDVTDPNNYKDPPRFFPFLRTMPTIVIAQTF